MSSISSRSLSMSSLIFVPLELLAAATAPVLVDRHRLLASALHVALDELLGILLENVVDLVEELVDVLLDLRTARTPCRSHRTGTRRSASTTGLRAARSS